jgi:hypothetical protein
MMAKLIYTAISSIDGYVADEDGNFDWAEPDEEVHTFVNSLEATSRPSGDHWPATRHRDPEAGRAIRQSVMLKAVVR